MIKISKLKVIRFLYSSYVCLHMGRAVQLLQSSEAAQRGGSLLMTHIRAISASLHSCSNSPHKYLLEFKISLFNQIQSVYTQKYTHRHARASVCLSAHEKLENY